MNATANSPAKFLTARGWLPRCRWTMTEARAFPAGGYPTWLYRGRRGKAVIVEESETLRVAVHRGRGRDTHFTTFDAESAAVMAEALVR